MALLSMTGFGHGDASSKGIKVEVDLSSVNRKQFDLRLIMQRHLMVLEPRIYEQIHKIISRGSITCSVKINISGKFRQRGLNIDMDAARSHIHMLRKAALDLNLKDDLTARSLLYLPEVIKDENNYENPEEIWSLMKKALICAGKQLVDARKVEGKALEKDIIIRLNKSQGIFTKIKKTAPRFVKKYREKLLLRMEKAGFNFNSKNPDILKEVALFVDRSDISEEIVRLESHFKRFESLMDTKGPVGRTFDFLCQEMFREINTIGSKANNEHISGYVIQFKALLETVREQIQNVE